MKLREKTLTIAGITLVGLIIILYVTSQVIIKSSFLKLEEEYTRENVERVLNAVSDSILTMNSTASDWAAWDDTYAFVEDRNWEYIENNLMDATLVNLRLNIMMFVNSSGGVVFKKAVDLDEETEVGFPESLDNHIFVNSYLLTHKDTGDFITGIILLPEGPLLIASQPILTSYDEGPIRGSLILGRYLNSAEIDRLEQMTQLSVSVHSIKNEMPPDFRDSLPVLEKDTIFVTPLDEEIVAGYTLLTDVYGESILVLRVDLPRDIYLQGKTTVNYFIVSLLLAGLVVGGLSLLLMESLILSRLTRLSTNVSMISKSDELSTRVDVTGNDELSNLAHEINTLLEAVEQSTRRVHESLKEKEILLREIHHRVKNNMQIISSLLNLQVAYIKDKETAEMFRDSQERIKAMALVHEKLYKSQDLANINFQEYIKDLVHDLSQSYRIMSGAISLTLDVEDVSLGVDTAIPLGLVINELVSNSLKHAFPGGRGSIRIALDSTEEGIVLTVSDNGVGIPEYVDFRHTESLGLNLVTILAEDQLGGEITLNRKDGTEFRIKIKEKKYFED